MSASTATPASTAEARANPVSRKLPGSTRKLPNLTLGTGGALTRLPRTTIRGSAPSPAMRERGCKAQGVQSESPSPAPRERGDPARKGWVGEGLRLNFLFGTLSTTATAGPPGRYHWESCQLMASVTPHRYPMPYRRPKRRLRSPSQTASQKIYTNRPFDGHENVTLPRRFVVRNARDQRQYESIGYEAGHPGT